MKSRFGVKICLSILLAVFCTGFAFAGAPVVVKTNPQAFAQDVEPSLEAITVTFDQPMMDESWSWIGGGKTFPKTIGHPSYDSKKTSCRFQVKLEPGRVYWVGINNQTYDNFKSADGISAQPYVILFATKTSDGKPTSLPKDMLKEAKAVNNAATRPQTGQNAKSKPAATGKLSFALHDSMGREIRSEDYAGVPVLIMCGSCWCGGCQQDAEPLREIAEEFMPKGLAVIRSVSGDNELAATDFAKHYRLTFPQLMDTNRAFEKQYNPDGWTFLMMADGEGKIVFKCNSPEQEDWAQIKQFAEKLAKETDANQMVTADGIQYMRKTLERSGETQAAKQRDDFTSIACAADRKVYLVFTTNRNSNSDIFMRIFDSNKWSEDKPIAATQADEYDGTIIVDSNNCPWVVWTSNDKEGKYSIYASMISNSGETCETKQVDIGRDDAMHGRLASDEKGNIWVTYYKWLNMGVKSRDKEVYVRRFDGTQWSKQVQVSPTDVPDYEDHTEPAITAYGDGAIVCWSWDFHQPKGYTKDAAEPTIFARRILSDMQPAKPIVLSATDIDVTPDVSILNNGQIWCVWDSLGWDKQARAYRKKVCTKQAIFGPVPDTSKIIPITEPVVNVCTLSIAVSKKGKACLLWSQTNDGTKWELKRSDFDTDNKKWLTGQTIESNDNPRFCSVDFDSTGKLWVAYSAQTEKGREIIVKQF